jgi:hypothetical protein
MRALLPFTIAAEPTPSRGRSHFYLPPPVDNLARLLRLRPHIKNDTRKATLCATVRTRKLDAAIPPSREISQGVCGPA